MSVDMDGASDLATGSDSPVRLDSSTSRWLASIIRQSAGTASPVARAITSPGMSASDSMRLLCPPCSTDTCCWLARSSERTAFSAWYRSPPPMRALSVDTAPTMAASALDPTAADRAAPAASTSVNGLASSAPTAAAKRAGSPASRATGASRPAPLDEGRPPRLVPKRARTSSTSSMCQGGPPPMRWRGRRARPMPARQPLATAAMRRR